MNINPEIIEEFKSKIENSQSETEVRKWFRKIMGLQKSAGNTLYNKTKAKIYGNNDSASNNFKIDNIIAEHDEALEDIINKLKINQDDWGVDDFSVKELSSGKFLWTIYFKRNRINSNTEKLLEDIIPSPEVIRANYDIMENAVLAEINLCDLHLGKLCWKDETGHNYDIKTASKIFNDAIDYKILQLSKYPVEKILFPVGNDFYQVDNLENTTTAGTQQDVDSRYGKMFREGVRLTIGAINRLSEIAPVDILITPGNHDKLSIFFLGEILEIYYMNNENVLVDTSLLPRKYYKYGKCLMGYTHGDGIKLNDLPMIMATEASKWWGETKHRYIHAGHFHHQKMILNEVSGVIVDIFPSLSGTDSWHKSKGYVGNIRSAVTAIYDKEMGLVGKIYYNL